MITLPFWLGVLAAIIMAAAIGSLAYTASAIVLPETETRVRFCATAVGVFWLQGVAFYLLMALQFFNLVGAMILAAASGGLVAYLFRNFSSLRERFFQDVEHLRGLFPPSAASLTFGSLVGGLVIVNLTRALTLPNIAWDALVYHMTKASLWVQSSGLSSYATAGAKWELQYYRPPLGNALAAWTVMPVTSDALVSLTFTGVWLALVLAVYTTARNLGADRTQGLVAALVAGTIPTISHHMFTAYIDNLVAALLMLGVAMLTCMDTRKRLWAGAFGIVALSTALAVKKTIVPFFGIGGVLLVYLLWRDHREQMLRFLAVAIVLGLLIALPPYLYIWWETGNPVYPFTVKWGGEVIFQGNEMANLQRESKELSTMHKLMDSFWNGYGPWYRHMNLGPAMPMVLIAGLVATLRHVWHKIARPSLVLYGPVCAYFLWFVIQHPNGTGLNEMRYIVGAAIFFVAVAAAWKHWRIRGLLELTILVNLIYFLPVINWGPPDTRAAGEFALRAVPFVVAGAGLFWWYGFRQKTSRFVAGAAGGILVACLSLAFVLEPVRAEYRHDIYRSAARGKTFINFPVTGGSAPSFPSAPVWRELDDPNNPHKVAVVAGWDGRGIHWFVHPTFGSRLQNTVTYVPITESGEFIDPPRTSGKARRQGDYQVWRQRLLDRNIEYVQTMAPRPIELRWMKGHSEHFELVTRGRRAGNRLYRVLEGEEVAQRKRKLESRVSQTPPSPEHELDAKLGEFARVIGYDVSPNQVRAGKEFTITYHYKALSEIPPKWKVFVHGEGSGPYQNLTGYEAGEGFYPLEKWEPGTYVSDEHTIRVPHSWNEGKYIVYLGIYHPRKGRVPIEGTTPTDGIRRLKVAEIEVHKR